MKTARTRRGFTLWEMAMVLVILAILTSLAVPAYVKLGADKQRTSSEMLIDLINDARRIAVKNNVMATLIIDPETGHYRVDTVGTAGMGLVAEDTLHLGVSESLDTSLPRLRYMFRPTGASFGDTVAIRGGDTTQLVIVDHLSGVARAQAR